MAKKRVELGFDSLVLGVFGQIPYLGPKLAYHYLNSWFGRFVKYGTWILLEFWLVKGPMTWLFTDIVGLWYVLSAFIAGTVCTVIGFGLSELWIWKARKRRG